MWYVIQVRTGDELKIAERLKFEIKTDDEDFFVPLYERRRHRQGKWIKETRPLFPGYIFFKTEDAADLQIRLMKINAFKRILKTGDSYTPISPDEERFIRSLIGDDYVAVQSVGVIEGDNIIVMQGPLRGLEGSIVKVDRHKRIAIIKTDFMGGAREIKVGLEVVDKRPAEDT